MLPRLMHPAKSRRKPLQLAHRILVRLIYKIQRTLKLFRICKWKYDQTLKPEASILQ
jgi:hypothetical protein